MISELFKREGFIIDEKQERKFSIYLEELLKWNKIHNLTSIKDPEEIVKRHFIDSVSVVRCFEDIGLNWEGKHFADVGSGAGFPGIPLKIYLKDIKLTLIESVSKKCSFLEYLKVKLNEDYRVLCTRAEKVQEKFDIVLARALGEFEEIKEILENLSKGYVFIYKGSKVKKEWLRDYNLCQVSLSFMPKSYILWKKV